MKVILVNGSPHQTGATYTALDEIRKTLEQEGIEAEIFQIGTNPIASCRGCADCIKQGRCVINDDSKVNEFLELAEQADGFVFGTPTHFDGPYGNLVSFMNRVFYVGCIGSRKRFRLKPVAAIAVARRSGTTSAFAQLYKFFIEMIVVSSRFNSCAFGNNAEEVLQDKEGLNNMHIIGKNMAYVLKCKSIASEAGLLPPPQEENISTNFIR